VSVVIITYRRVAGLSKLLECLDDQALDGLPRIRLSIIVVDNDREGSAAEVVRTFRPRRGVEVRYVPETIQGIPVARNTGLAHVPADAEFCCLIDDDEWPATYWLRELVLTQRATAADCVMGPVIPVF